ncbi:hypothetical protein [Streptomyces sp. NPDC057325]|uniref:hypothetical protein n=1 Tax=unclassified Streptomyces TaxID=2593676 RepID=UPI0036351065
MDAVVAALLGTLLGSLATIGAAVVSGRSQREGARIAARAQYIKDLHAPRSAGYKSFMKMATDLKIRVLDNDGYEESTRQEVRDLRNNVFDQWESLSLLGPTEVTVSGSKVRDSALDLLSQMDATRNMTFMHSLNRGASEDEEEAAREAYENSLRALDELAFSLIERVDEFATVASAALNDDGTGK